MSEVSINDAELEALMAELEAQNAEIVAAAEQAAPQPTPKPTPEPEPTPEVSSEPDANCVTLPDGSCVGGLQAGKEPCMHDRAVTTAHEGTAPLVKDEETGKLSTSGSVAAPSVAAPMEPSVTHAAPSEQPAKFTDPLERRVVMNEDGSVKQPAMSFEPRQNPAEKASPNGLQHHIDVDQFRVETRVTEHNLDQCMIEQSGLRAYYGALAARAEAQAARVKAKFEVVEATLYDHHRKQLAASGEKVTEKMVENAVKLDPRWLKAKNLVIEGETIATINKSLVESLKDRRDMIIQLGADRRDEYKGAARVLAEQQGREELRDRALRVMQGSRAA